MTMQRLHLYDLRLLLLLSGRRKSEASFTGMKNNRLNVETPWHLLVFIPDVYLFPDIFVSYPQSFCGITGFSIVPNHMLSPFLPSAHILFVSPSPSSCFLSGIFKAKAESVEIHGLALLYKEEI